jgi:hypothetical protein
MILLAAVRERLGGNAVRAGTVVTGFAERDGSVEVLPSDRLEDVLSPAELAGLRDAYRATSLQDVVALNTRPSLQP